MIFNPRPRKNTLAAFLDVDKGSNAVRFLYYRTEDELYTSNGHWLLCFPWPVVPAQFRGCFPLVGQGQTTVAGSAKFKDIGWHEQGLGIFEGAKRACTRPLVRSPFVFDNGRGFASRMLATCGADGSHEVWAGVNLEYLAALDNLFASPVSLAGEKPDRAMLVSVGDTPVGVIMPVLVESPLDWFTTKAAE
jgi:hypothetical protein